MILSYKSVFCFSADFFFKKSIDMHDEKGYLMSIVSYS